MRSNEPNPYASPQTAPAAAAAGPTVSAWRNRLAAAGFLLSMLFPLAALAAVTGLFLEDDFGVVRWRVHRSIRFLLFNASLSSLAAVVVSLAGLAATPRKLAFYGALIGLLGSSYWCLAMLGILRR
jgi:hypothetical protein